MTLLISDANVLIDMETAGLLELMFRLPERFAVPNILYEEELMEQHPELPARGLQIIEIRDEFVFEANRLRTQYKRPSMNDLFALALAKQEDCPLLTGDSRLREAAESERVQVRGTLWLMEQLLAAKLLDLVSLRQAYDVMLQHGRRLPLAEIEAQMQRL